MKKRYNEEQIIKAIKDPAIFAELTSRLSANSMPEPESSTETEPKTDESPNGDVYDIA